VPYRIVNTVTLRRRGVGFQATTATSSGDRADRSIAPAMSISARSVTHALISRTWRERKSMSLGTTSRLHAPMESWPWFWSSQFHAQSRKPRGNGAPSSDAKTARGSA
jgi:hypothetical protein